jgi:hypothetical protein
MVKRRQTSGIYPFTEIYRKDERITRSAVYTSSPLLSLRPCMRRDASWRVGWVRSVAFLNILQVIRTGAKTDHS